MVTAPNLATELHSCTKSLSPSWLQKSRKETPHVGSARPSSCVCSLEKERTAPKTFPIHITATARHGWILQPKAITTIFFKAGSYKRFPSGQTTLLKDRFHLSSSRELVLIHTDVTEDIDTPGINKLLSFNFLTVVAQIHFCYQWEIQGSSR